MSTLKAYCSSFAVLFLVAACSPETPVMTAEDLQKPENASALEKALASCKMVMPGDSRAVNCKAANAAKLALDAQDIGRIRRAQHQERAEKALALEGGVTSVPQTKTPATVYSSRDALVR